MAGEMRLPFFHRSPEPDHLIVPHGDARFRVALKRRATAQRLTLRVSTATGDVTLSLPERADIAAAERFALAHGGWIAARLAKRPQHVAFVPGASVPLRGAPHRIVHWSSIRAATRALADKDGQPIIAVAGEIAHVTRRVTDFLKAEARRDLEAAVQVHTRALGIPARKLVLRDTTSRWGSCSSRGHLSFSWRLILAPPLVLDYLAAHEVAHLKEMNHSHRFWAVVHGLCLHTEDAEKWLKKNGSSLHHYG
jgi:predicted metal-dependent hydrolase